MVHDLKRVQTEGASGDPPGRHGNPRLRLATPDLGWRRKLVT
jgi:hypothetical protein